MFCWARCWVVTDGSSTIKFKSILVCHCSDFVFSKGNTSNMFSCVIAIIMICIGSIVKIADYRLKKLPKIYNPRLKHPPGGHANFAPYMWWSCRSLAHMYFIFYLPFITRLWESLNDILKSNCCDIVTGPYAAFRNPCCVFLPICDVKCDTPEKQTNRKSNSSTGKGKGVAYF